MTDGYHGNSGGGPEGSHKMAGGRQSNEVWDDDYVRQKKSLEPTAAGGRDGRLATSPSTEVLTRRWAEKWAGFGGAGTAWVALLQLTVWEVVQVGGHLIPVRPE